MRIVYILILIFISCVTFAQQQNWTIVNSNSVVFANLNSKLLQHHDREFVELYDSKLYHIKFKSNFEYVINEVENAGLDLSDFVLIDVNRDGDKDILAHRESGPLEIYLYEGDKFVFHPEIEITPYKMGKLTVLDYDKDGYEDLLFIEGIFINKGPFQFVKEYDMYGGFSGPGYKPLDVYAYDYDSDGDDDVVSRLVNNPILKTRIGGTANFTSNSIANLSANWINLINTTKGKTLLTYHTSLQKIQKINFATGSGTTSLTDIITLPKNYNIPSVIYDFDDDGNDEIVEVLSNLELRILKYNPDDSTITYKTFTTGSNVNAFIKCEIDGETFLLIRVSGAYRFLKYNKTINNFETFKSTSHLFIANQFMDVDGDKNVDLVINNVIKRYLGNGVFGDKVALNFNNGFGSYRDYDVDGDLDVVLPEGWYENIGNLNFTEYKTRTPDPGKPYQEPMIYFTSKVLYIDLDNDGDEDLITYNGDQPVKVFENQNNLSFIDRDTIVTDDLIGGNLKYVNALDFDNDGDKDILIAAVYGVNYIENLGGMKFNDEIQLFGGNVNTVNVDVKDINNDNFLDLIIGTGHIIAGGAGGVVNLFMGSNRGLVKNAKLILGTNGYQKVKFIDVDSTGWQDAVVLNGHGISYMLLNDTSNISTVLIKSNVSNNGIIEIKDVDGDNKEDVIFSCSNCEAGSPKLNNRQYYLVRKMVSDDLRCPDGNLYLRNQEQVDAFSEKYGGCKVIDGNLFLGRGVNDWADIINFNALSSIEIIKGDLTIDHINGISNFNGLHNLDSIYGNLHFPQLKLNHFKGLENLKYIGKDFSLFNGFTGFPRTGDFYELRNATINGSIRVKNSDVKNVRLKKQKVYNGDIIFETTSVEDIEFLSDVEEVKGVISFTSSKLSSLSRLKKLKSMKSLIIHSDYELSDVAICNDLDSIEGDISILPIGTVGNQTAFRNLKYVGGNFFLTGKVCFPILNLNYIGGSFGITMDTFTNSFFQNIDYVGNSLSFSYKSNNQQPFKLTTVNKDLTVSNSNLSKLEVLKNVTKVNGIFEIYRNNSLTNLDNLNDSLNVGGYSLRSNESLNYCNSVAFCNHLAKNGSYYLYDNGAFCNERSQIICNENFVSGIVFFDANKNGFRDSDENTIDNISIYLKDEKDTIVTSSNGYYSFTSTPGASLSINAKVNDKWIVTTAGNPYELIFESDNVNNNQYHFGLYPKEERHEVISNVNINRFLCNNNFETEIVIKNTGAYREKLRIDFIYPEGVLLNDTFIDYTNHDPLTRTLSWEIDNIDPFITIKKLPVLKAPQIMNLGDSYNFELNVSRDSVNEFIPIKKSILNKILLCSFDPNDKQVTTNSGSSGFQIDKNERLIYTIQFENLGNYYAEDIVVKDEISNRLDLNTFELINSSHEDYLTVIKNGQKINFVFKDINLPSKQMDSLKNKGYVVFAISPKSSVVYGTPIYNQAQIYFDFNEPIITNEVLTIIENLVGTSEIKNLQFIVYPNPANDYITLLSENKIIHANIFRKDGKKLLSSNDTRFDVKSLPPGLYYVVVFGDNGKIGSSKFVKM